MAAGALIMEPGELPDMNGQYSNEVAMELECMNTSQIDIGKDYMYTITLILAQHLQGLELIGLCE